MRENGKTAEYGLRGNLICLIYRKNNSKQRKEWQDTEYLFAKYFMPVPIKQYVYWF